MDPGSPIKFIVDASDVSEISRELGRFNEKLSRFSVSVFLLISFMSSFISFSLFDSLSLTTELKWKQIYSKK